MKSSVTIARTPRHHNRSCLLLPLTLLLGGCAASRPTPITVPTQELAAAEPAAPILMARARPALDHPLPPSLVQELCPEFSLVTITRPSEWNEVRRCLDLPPTAHPVDFSRGIIVGILANIGQPAEPAWPVCIRSVRKHSAVGRLEIAFTSGLYYPLQTARYLELAYIPDVRMVGMVSIGRRSFLIRPSATLN